MANELWTEKYRPKTLSEYVFTDERQKAQIEQWVSSGNLPNVSFIGSPGTGKTSIAKVLINELNVSPYDVLELNASRENNVDTVREKIVNFVQTIPFGAFKVVLLDEADFLSPSAQAILRGVFETYSATARFMLTLNYKNRIIPALHSRCQSFHIEKPDQVEFTSRIATILLKESVEFDLDDLDTYVKVTYPDLRKCINLVQQNTMNGKLSPPTTTESESTDYLIEMVNLFKKRDFRGARKLICTKSQPEEHEGIYTWLYQNLDLISNDDEIKDQAVVIIKQGLVDHAICADSELNLAATLVKLARLV